MTKIFKTKKEQNKFYNLSLKNASDEELINIDRTCQYVAYDLMQDSEFEAAELYDGTSMCCTIILTSRGYERKGGNWEKSI